MTCRFLTASLLTLSLTATALAEPPAMPSDEGALPEEESHTLAGGARQGTIPFQFAANQVRLAAMIDSRGPLQLVLDTGMPMTGVLLFESERLGKLGVAKAGVRVEVAGAGGSGQSTKALMAEGVDITLGPLSIAKTRALVVPRPPGFSPTIDGVIGGSLFYNYVVRVDMDHKRVELSVPDGWSPPTQISRVPLVRENGMIFVDVPVAVGNEAPQVARVVVDLGAGHALSLNARADGRFAAPAGAIEMPLGRGLSGLLHGKAGRVRRIELGSFAFEQVVVSFPREEHQQPAGGEFHDGNLGAELLKRFNVTFDYAGQRMLLEKARGFDAPFEAPMSGVDLEWQPDSTLIVRAVIPGSPAALAGIVSGDALLAINGTPTGTLQDDGVRAALLVDGAELKFKLRRGQQILEKKLKLRRLI